MAVGVLNSSLNLFHHGVTEARRKPIWRNLPLATLMAASHPPRHQI
jgi:hypothetical protein